MGAAVLTGAAREGYPETPTSKKLTSESRRYQMPGGAQYRDPRCSLPGVLEEEEEASVTTHRIKGKGARSEVRRGGRLGEGGLQATVTPSVHALCEMGSQPRACHKEVT